MKAGKRDEAEQAKESVRFVNEQIAALDAQLGRRSNSTPATC